MKKLLLVSLMFVASISQAACFGPYCYTDTGSQIMSGLSIPAFTVATMNQNAPSATGQLIFVSDGLQAKVCISSGTGNGAYTVIAATSAAVLGGLLGHCN